MKQYIVTVAAYVEVYTDVQVYANSKTEAFAIAEQIVSNDEDRLWYDDDKQPHHTVYNITAISCEEPELGE